MGSALASSAAMLAMTLMVREPKPTRAVSRGCTAVLRLTTSGVPADPTYVAEVLLGGAGHGGRRVRPDARDAAVHRTAPATHRTPPGLGLLVALWPRRSTPVLAPPPSASASPLRSI
jgi:hypothetical protein